MAGALVGAALPPSPHLILALPRATRSEPAERRLDLSNNSFSGGPFPMWLVDQLFQELDACGTQCKITVKGAPGGSRQGLQAASSLQRRRGHGGRAAAHVPHLMAPAGVCWRL